MLKAIAHYSLLPYLKCQTDKINFQTGKAIPKPVEF